jgi:hypothetical protein
MCNICPSILLYSKLAIRKEEGNINRERRKRNFCTENNTFLVIHHPLMVEKKTGRSP